MKTLAKILATAVITVSLAANLWMGNERIQVKFYQKGRADARDIVVNQIIKQVQKTGRLTVTMPDGQLVVLSKQPSNIPVPVPADAPLVKDPNTEKTP